MLGLSTKTALTNQPEIMALVLDPRQRREQSKEELFRPGVHRTVASNLSYGSALEGPEFSIPSIIQKTSRVTPCVVLAGRSVPRRHRLPGQKLTAFQFLRRLTIDGECNSLIQTIARSGSSDRPKLLLVRNAAQTKSS